MKSEAVSALPKLRRGLGGADFEDGFLKDAGHDRVYCFRLAPKVRLPSDSENDRQSLIQMLFLYQKLRCSNNKMTLVELLLSGCL